MNLEAVARVCHEVNRAYCESLGDTSQPTWENAPDWQKESVINGVDLHNHNPMMTPENSHKAWMLVKEREGWVYGAEKDAEAKTHPCMVPYEQLPQEQRAKDYIFKAVVNALRVYPRS